MPQMKCSQSMSSLATPENHRKSPTNTRLCSSSRKPRRTFEKKMWRRSWGSYERSYDDRGGGEDDVQMQEEEIHGNLISKVTVETNLGQFLEDYTVICDWLNYAQVQRGNSADAGTLSELGTELLRRQPWRIQINENAKSLLKSFPLLKEECGWRMRHLNSQWDALEKILLCQSPAVAVETGKKSGNDSGIDWLREWLSEMEDQLQPLDFRTQWNPELVKILVEHHKGLQSEIESKSDKVHESLRQFEESAREIAKKSRLEKRWWQLRLRVLEWIQHLEGVRINLNNQLKKGNKSIGRESVLSSDEETAEPLTKYRRLGNGDINSVATEEVHSNEEFNFIDEEKDVVMGQLHDDSVCITPQQSPLYTPTSGSSSSINSSHSSHTHSSSSSTSQNLKRKPTHKNYSKLPPFDHAPLSHAPFHLDDLLDGANISTYYFKHSEQKEMLSCQPTSHPPSGVAMETNSDTIAFSSGGEDKLDAVQSQNQSPSNVESENMDFNRGLTTMVAMETKNRIKLEKEIGDLVEKAEELAKRNFNGGDFLGGFISSGEDEECEDPVAIETSVSASAKIKDKSFAKLKEKFTKMEEILVETRKKIKSGGNCGGVVQSGGCDAGGVVGKKLKTARVRQWVRQNSKENSENHHGNAGRRFKPPPTTTPGGSCDASAESDSSSHFSSTSSDDPTTTTTSTLLLHQTQATLNFLRNRSSTSDDSAAEFVSKKKKPRPKSFEFHSSDTAAFLGGGGCGSDESLGRRKRVRKRGGRRKSDAGENVGVGVEKGGNPRNTITKSPWQPPPPCVPNLRPCLGEIPTPTAASANERHGIVKHGTRLGQLSGKIPERAVQRGSLRSERHVEIARIRRGLWTILKSKAQFGIQFCWWV
ncbi:hypothetical protein Fcan01_04550 [Folsomia candida]|uniref:Uncharacterized protein n=1 Tax=Folsomia candida TaxID=158441 RepID=A0A226EUP9_FOLCA|nr:hypothetical protein Fcan01_04550 [Folsomia candida]